MKHELLPILSALADRIAKDAFINYNGAITLTTDEKRALMWAATLIEGNNIRFKVVERVDTLG